MAVIENEQEKGKVFLNKMSAGERQLASAIRMYFLEEDALAVHTISSAAHNILADLLQARGKDASVHGSMYGLLRLARDFHEGQISEGDIRKMGDGAIDVAQDLQHLFGNDQDFNVEEIATSAPPEHRRAYWAEMRRSYNYLKHADRDANELLDEASINNEDTILSAIVCSQHLNMKHTAEKHFFYCAMISLGRIEGGGERPLDLELLMSGLSQAEIFSLGRKNLCGVVLDGDDVLLERAAHQIRENSESCAGKDVRFFDVT